MGPKPSVNIRFIASNRASLKSYDNPSLARELEIQNKQFGNNFSNANNTNNRNNSAILANTQSHNNHSQTTQPSIVINGGITIHQHTPNNNANGFQMPSLFNLFSQMRSRNNFNNLQNMIQIPSLNTNTNTSNSVESHSNLSQLHTIPVINTSAPNELFTQDWNEILPMEPPRKKRTEIVHI